LLTAGLLRVIALFAGWGGLGLLDGGVEMLGCGRNGALGFCWDVEVDHHLVEFRSSLGESLDLTFFAILGISAAQVGILFSGDEVLNLSGAEGEQWGHVLLFVLLDCTASQLFD
jgi:hypothetical protein